MPDETPIRLHENATGSAPGGPGLPAAPSTVNPLAELVADLLEPTGLVPLDRLASVRRVGSGSFAEALREAGLASDKGVARALATRHHLPFVDILEQDVQAEALEHIRPAVRDRVRALPYHFDGQTIRVAIADPANIAAIDELRLATAFAIELAFLKSVKAGDLAVFSRQLSTMINSGMSILRALYVLEEQTESKFLRETIVAVRKDVEAGLPLSDAMARHQKVFSTLFVAMTQAVGDPVPTHSSKRGSTPVISQAARRLRPSRTCPSCLTIG